MQEVGLDKTTTYCKADYKSVGIVAEQIQRVKSNCPLFFSAILKTVCAVSFNDNYSAALKQKSSMDSMILANNKNRKSTTHDDLIRRCFRNRTPAALTGLLHKVSELYVLAAPVYATLSTSPDASASPPTTVAWHGRGGNDARKGKREC
jgi:hypothetical protein